MPAFIQSNYAKGTISPPYPSHSGETISHRFAIVAAATLALGDIIELAVIPPNCRVVDIVLDVDKLDDHETETISLDVGLMSGNWGVNDDTRTCGDEFFDGDTTARGGGVARPSLVSAYRVGTSPVARGIGVKVAAAAATKAAGTIGLTVSYATA